MPATATTIGDHEQQVLVVVGPRAVDVAPRPARRGASQCSSRLRLSQNGSWISPPTIDSPASTTSGNSMIGGDSWGLKSPWSPCSAAAVLPAGLAEEHHHHLAGHVVGGEQRGHQADDVERRALGQAEQQDLVLRPEPGEGRHAGDRQPADDERERGDGHEHAQQAHAAHVLLVVHPVDDRAGPEEQQRLEEGVRDHVEDGRDVGARADGEEHVAELADRRVGEHPS